MNVINLPDLPPGNTCIRLRCVRAAGQSFSSIYNYFLMPSLIALFNNNGFCDLVWGNRSACRFVKASRTRRSSLWWKRRGQEKSVRHWPATLSFSKQVSHPHIAYESLPCSYAWKGLATPYHELEYCKGTCIASGYIYRGHDGKLTSVKFSFICILF